MNIQSISHTETKLKVDSRNVDLKSVTEKKTNRKETIGNHRPENIHNIKHEFTN